MKSTKQYKEDIKKVIDNIPSIEKLKGKRILITGATGLICSAVADILFELNQSGFGIEIVLAGRNADNLKKRFEDYNEGVDYSFLLYDATANNNEDDLEIDYVVHGASNADPAKIISEPVETILANVQGLNSLMSMLDKSKVERLLYISSSEVYGINETMEPYKEDQLGYIDILNVRASYPNSKRVTETMCVSYSEEYDIDTVIVRPGHIYGPTIKFSDSRASALFSIKAANGEDIVMKSEGSQLRSYCHSLDCASAIIAVLLNGDRGQAYNISSSKAVITIKEMAEAFAEVGDVRIIFDLPTDSESKSYNMMSCSALNSEKLEALGWKAEFDIKTGAAHTVEMLKERLS